MSTQDLATHAWNWITTAGRAIWYWASTASASTYSAIVSAGALWTAARADRRQGDQTRRAQASMVTLHRRATEEAGPLSVYDALNRARLHGSSLCAWA